MPAEEDSKKFRLGYELGGLFATETDLDRLCSLVISKCRNALDCEAVSILLLDRERGELYFPYIGDERPEVVEKLKAVRIPADRGIAGAVLQSGRSENVTQADSDPRHYGEADRQSGVATSSMLAVQLRTRTEAIGVIEAVNHRSGTRFGDEDLALLEVLAEPIAIAIENARTLKRARESEEKLRAEVGALRRDLARQDRFTEIVAVSPAMFEVFGLMEGAAGSSISVLVQGETGTGKELVARAIHRSSARADAPFLAVNCAAFTETLLESELFGHRRGAFTGASSDHLGLFRAADGGTVFLDEVGDMPIAMQAKLLRVLQEGEVTPVGEVRPHKVDVRVIAATNRDLKARIAERDFREDLYYRLAGLTIQLPPLRNRREDIPLLAVRFLEAACTRHRKRMVGFSPAALTVLTQWRWPGNVRELQNEVERAVALGRPDATIEPEHLSAALRAPAQDGVTESGAAQASPAAGATGLATGSGSMALREARRSFEIRLITEALSRHGGNVTHTAAELGISRIALQKKMKELGLR